MLDMAGETAIVAELARDIEDAGLEERARLVEEHKQAAATRTGWMSSESNPLVQASRRAEAHRAQVQAVHQASQERQGIRWRP